ncbi:ATPase inhibitor protein trans-spliced [Fasciolopsis buskii]|uniref:ATPase inhibitor protein trans-spliced n=1 Tax=Fasciolopsis buskii TaxID=27845 RepID=A0A8E0RLN4_9TREM|nr:ATPase inhibitor protein trans-spliced [Fasciolopsis buski]
MFGGSLPGSGAGKGGGAGGSIREAGGALGKRGAALEDLYFRRQDAEQLKKLRKKLNEKSKPSQTSSVKSTLIRIRQGRLLVLAATMFSQVMFNIVPPR